MNIEVNTDWNHTVISFYTWMLMDENLSLLFYKNLWEIFEYTLTRC